MGKSPEIPTVSLERLPDGICMSPIRPSVCPRDIYKTNETSSCTSSQIWHTPNNLLGRHFVHEPNSYRASAGHVDSNSFIRKPRFCNKLNKISTEANPDSRISGVYSGTKNMTPVLPQGKVTAIKDLCSQMLSQTELTVRDIARLIGKLTASIQAIFPAPLHYCQLQSLKNTALQSGGNYNTKVSLNPACQEELQWWIAHLNENRNRCITTGLGGCMQRSKDRGPLVSERTTSAHQLSGTTCRGFCSEMFHKEPDMFACSPQNGQHNCHCILKLGGTRSLVLSNLVAELWSWALNRGMILSAEHLPGKWNTQVDQGSRHYQDSSDWHLEPSLFLALMKIRDLAK